MVALLLGSLGLQPQEGPELLDFWKPRGPPGPTHPSHPSQMHPHVLPANWGNSFHSVSYSLCE